jgi:hypothetical protein
VGIKDLKDNSPWKNQGAVKVIYPAQSLFFFSILAGMADDWCD